MEGKLEERKEKEGLTQRLNGPNLFILHVIPVNKDEIPLIFEWKTGENPLNLERVTQFSYPSTLNLKG